SVKKFLDQIMQHRMAWPFLEPVDGHLYPSYYQGPHAVMDPIDLCTIKMKLEQGSYAGAGAVKADVDGVWENCRHFNGETHLYSTMADELERRFNKKLNSL
ncbi:hypothetical protein EMIHUDRAFT_48601, partial [Emiliania huxleyi CCMP1516]|uniref:Bromo domain-containing protein n=2 Tax=Emiliania huxleyi TaxID=2903 RepID=A0A0D3JWV4_EMIH1